jgi:hypothetical protein
MLNSAVAICNTLSAAVFAERMRHRKVGSPNPFAYFSRDASNRGKNGLLNRSWV